MPQLPFYTAGLAVYIALGHLMEQKDFEYLEKLSDRELFDFLTETDASQRKHVAVHLLELRRNMELTRAARSSARAAWLAAIIAGIAAVVAVLAYINVRLT